MLSKIGIEKAGHRKLLLVKLYNVSGKKRSSRNVFHCCPVKGKASAKGNWTPRSVEDWLSELRLGKLAHKFLEAGFESMDEIREMMLSPYPITEEVLRDDIQIDKPGHRFRILGKLLFDTKRTDISVYKEPVCESCLIL